MGDVVFELPGFEVLELVGSGGTGEVWRARDAAGNEVALKRLRDIGDGARDRLRREAALVSAASGDHVVRVRDVVTHRGESVLVMDYAAGGSVAEILTVRGRLAAPEVVTLVGPIAGALADVHERGIVHGDVTPANLLFGADGRPLLTDFGVARVVGELGSAPVEATEPYAAPEVRGGRPPGPPADVYSLCRIALEALDPATAPPGLLAALEAGTAADPHDRPDARTVALDVLSVCAAAPVTLVRPAAPVRPPVTTQVVVAPPAPVADEEPPPRRRGRYALPRRRRLPRVPRAVPHIAAAVVALSAAVVAGIGWARHTGPSAAVLPPARVVVTPSGAPAPAEWAAVVQRLDQDRTGAFTSADPERLDQVYVPASAALDVDRRALLTLVAEGLEARGLTATTTRVAVVRADAASATLRVTHVLSSYVLVDVAGHVVRRVPASSSRTFTMRLERVAGEWRVASTAA